MFTFSFKYTSRCKPLYRGLVSSGGRNFTGRLSLLRRSGPKNTWKYCYIDYIRIVESSHMILRFDFNSFKNCYLMLVYDFTFGLSYYSGTSGLVISQIVFDNSFDRYGVGSSIKLQHVSPGQVVHDVCLTNFGRSKFGRSSGVSLVVLSFSNKGRSIVCKLPSGLTKSFGRNSSGIIGRRLDNFYFNLQSSNKAGFWVNRGFRPSVRGVAKNPVDHPHGGGEGKKSKPSSPKSPWGWVTV